MHYPNIVWNTFKIANFKGVSKMWLTHKHTYKQAEMKEIGQSIPNGQEVKEPNEINTPKIIRQVSMQNISSLIIIPCYLST